MAFSTIYESQAENTLTNQIADATTVFVSMALVVGVALIVEGRVDAPVGGNLRWLLERALLFGVLTFALLPMVFYFPTKTTCGSSKSFSERSSRPLGSCYYNRYSAFISPSAVRVYRISSSQASSSF